MKFSPIVQKAVILLLICGFFIVVNITGFSNKIKNFFYLGLASIQQSLWRAGGGISDFFETIGEISSLKKENESLKKQNQELAAENALLQERNRDDEALRKALDIGLQEDFKVALAEVVFKDISQDSIIINRGVKDGLQKDMAVITPEKIFVGKINQVFENFSEIILVSNKDISFDVKIQPKNISGLLKGRGNSQVVVDLIPPDEVTAINDRVVTSSLGGIFPEGILIGHIKSIRRNPSEPFQQAEIQVGFEFKEIDQLFVILGKQ